MVRRPGIKERGRARRPRAAMPSAEGAAHLPPKTPIAYGPCRALVAPGERVRLHPPRETCAVLARGLSQARTDPRQVLPTAPRATAGSDQHRRAATRCAFLCQAKVVWPESLPSSRLTLPRVRQQRTWTSRDISVKDLRRGVEQAFDHTHDRNAYPSRPVPAPSSRTLFSATVFGFRQRR